MTYKSIGLRARTVRLEPYNPEWKLAFREEAILLREALLLPASIGIEHIGSTAITGMPSKPIIDIMIGIVEVTEQQKVALHQSGYHFRENGGVDGRLFFAKEESGIRYFHLSICDPGGDFWWEHIEFRNWLRVDRRLFNEYGDLKRELAHKFPNNHHEYTDGKGPFVEKVLKRRAASFAPTSAEL